MAITLEKPETFDSVITEKEVKVQRLKIACDINAVVKYFKFHPIYENNIYHHPHAYGDPDVYIEKVANHCAMRVLFKSGTTQEKIYAFMLKQPNYFNLREIEVEEYKRMFLTSNEVIEARQRLRNYVRNVDDIEGDLTNQKVLIQTMFYLAADLFNTLTETQKKKLQHGEDFLKLVEVLTDEKINLRGKTLEVDKMKEIFEQETWFNNSYQYYKDFKNLSYLDNRELEAERKEKELIRAQEEYEQELNRHGEALAQQSQQTQQEQK